MRNNKEKMIEVKVNKELMEDFIAKAIFYTIGFITCAAVIFLIASLTAMIEAMAIIKASVIIAVVCVVWLGLIALACYLINRRK